MIHEIKYDEGEERDEVYGGEGLFDFLRSEIEEWSGLGGCFAENEERNG